MSASGREGCPQPRGATSCPTRCTGRRGHAVRRQDPPARQRFIVEKIVYDTVDDIERKTGSNPVATLKRVVENVGPRSRCGAGGSVAPPTRCRSRFARDVRHARGPLVVGYARQRREKTMAEPSATGCSTPATGWGRPQGKGDLQKMAESTRRSRTTGGDAFDSVELSAGVNRAWSVCTASVRHAGVRLQPLHAGRSDDALYRSEPLPVSASGENRALRAGSRPAGRTDRVSSCRVLRLVGGGTLCGPPRRSASWCTQSGFGSVERSKA